MLAHLKIEAGNFFCDGTRFSSLRDWWHLKLWGHLSFIGASFSGSVSTTEEGECRPDSRFTQNLCHISADQSLLALELGVAKALFFAHKWQNTRCHKVTARWYLGGYGDKEDEGSGAFGRHPCTAPRLPILTLAGKHQRQLVLTGTLAALALLKHQLTWENHIDPSLGQPKNRTSDEGNANF